MLNFEQFFILEANNYTFDLVNTQQFHNFIRTTIVDQTFRPLGAVAGRNRREAEAANRQIENYKSLVKDKLSKLMTKEIVLGMNKFLNLDGEHNEVLQGYEMHADEGLDTISAEQSMFRDMKHDWIFTPIFQQLIIGGEATGLRGQDEIVNPDGLFANIKDELVIARGDNKGYERKHLSNRNEEQERLDKINVTNDTNLKIIDNFIKAYSSDWMYDENRNLRDNLWYFLPAQMPAFAQGRGRRNLRTAFDAMVIDKDRTLLYDLTSAELDEYANDQGMDLHNPYMVLEAVGIADIYTHFTDFLLDNRLNPENASKSGIKYARSNEDAMKYFLKSPTTNTIARMVRDYELRFLPYVNSREITASIEDHAHVIYEWPDGIKIVQPTDGELCELIGKQMKHCVGGYDPTDIDAPILQLIDKDKMIATIELNLSFFDDEKLVDSSGQIGRGLAAELSDHGLYVYEVAQLKGFANGPVDGSYSGHLKEFFEKYQFDPENQNILSMKEDSFELIGDEDRIRAMIEKPSNLSHI